MQDRKNLLRSRFRGCLLAGAAGDALGYAVEFVSYGGIVARYGSNGIVNCELSPRTGTAVISDDTQMTLFTAAGLLKDAGHPKGERTVKTAKDAIYRAYLDWLKTQYAGKAEAGALILDDPRLFAARAPGNTCLSALGSGRCGDVGDPINDSKGCGGVMRVAPIGLYPGEDADEAGILELGAQAAAITHGHPLGYLPAALLALIVHRLAYAAQETPLDEVIAYCLCALEEQYGEDPCCDALVNLIDRARRLAKNDREDVDNIRLLGEGWVGEEALAIAVYCALRHEGDMAGTLIAAVNHGGDSDSTGAIAGNIAGAQLGEEALGERYLSDLELTDLIARIADALLENAVS